MYLSIYLHGPWTVPIPDCSLGLGKRLDQDLGISSWFYHFFGGCLSINATKRISCRSHNLHNKYHMTWHDRAYQKKSFFVKRLSPYGIFAAIWLDWWLAQANLRSVTGWDYNSACLSKRWATAINSCKRSWLLRGTRRVESLEGWGQNFQWEIWSGRLRCGDPPCRWAWATQGSFRSSSSQPAAAGASDPEASHPAGPSLNTRRTTCWSMGSCLTYQIISSIFNVGWM